MSQNISPKAPTIPVIDNALQSEQTLSDKAPISLQYCTVKQIVKDGSFCFSESTLRYYILNAHKNGLKKAIRKIGRKVLIRRDILISWLEKQAR